MGRLKTTGTANRGGVPHHQSPTAVLLSIPHGVQRDGDKMAGHPKADSPPVKHCRRQVPSDSTNQIHSFQNTRTRPPSREYC